MAQKYPDETALAEKYKLILSLPSLPNLRHELLPNNEANPDLGEVLRSFMLQIFCQLEQFGQHEKEDYWKWLKTCILNPQSSIHSFSEQIAAKTKVNAGIIKAVRQDVTAHMDNHSQKITNIRSTNQDDRADDCSDKKIFADGFMYDNESDFLQKHDLNSKYRCNSCGSTDTKPLDLVSHSASTESLIQLFTFRLPNLEGKKLLDIGSGLGSILYGAFYFSKAAEITGIELNSGFCKIVDKISTKYGMKPRVKVVDGDLKNYADLLRVQDVVVFNNSFEYFMAKPLQAELWQLINKNMKSGSVLVTNPDAVSIFKLLKLNFVNDEWLCEMPPQNIDSETLSGLDHTDERFHVYAIK